MPLIVHLKIALVKYFFRLTRICVKKVLTVDTFGCTMNTEIKGREVRKTDEKTKEALQDLLKILSDHPELADRITITIRPAKIKQGTDKRK